MYTAWRDMHSHISALWISPWGKILLIKVAFVGVAVLLGGSVRFRCLRRPATGDRAIAMSKLLRSEAAVMVAILCISGLLANTSPGI
ncbi:MAG TPA: CopD family protein [Bryobacteraceae bacterium]|nr:CopD family protein [Bryobacteraceae bacterium]